MDTTEPGRRRREEEFRPAWRYRVSRLALRLVVRLLFRFRVEGEARIPAGPAVICFNHLNWSDPLVIVAGLRSRRVFFLGPEQADMRHGARNRLMSWAGVAVPFLPGRRGLVAASRRVEMILRLGDPLAIAGEGRIHQGERVLLPLNDGPAYFALRFGVPVVPLAVNGTNWLGFRRRLRIRVGDPILASPAQPGRPDTVEIADLSHRIATAICDLVADFPDAPRPGRFGVWLTELFNEWPEGSRPE